jgi:hypothetical protein
MDKAVESLFSTTLSNKLWGYLQSPYDNRIVLFYESEKRGWEGPPNMMNLELIGTDFYTGH